jgi:hypothetical protein
MMKVLCAALMITVVACGGSNTATRNGNTALVQPAQPAAQPHEPKALPGGTTYESAQPGILSSPGESGDTEGNPAFGDD